jgi:hypothetical protein
VTPGAGYVLGKPHNPVPSAACLKMAET